MLLVEFANLTKTNPAHGIAPRRVVDDVSFTIERGQTPGIVGESGSGKARSRACRCGFTAEAYIGCSGVSRLRPGSSQDLPTSTRTMRRSQILNTLQSVDMDESALPRYPHEFPGGQRQRINLARALILRPDLVVLDEPTSALDVSVSAQIVQLLRELQRELHLTYIFITHSITLVRYMADEILVMHRAASSSTAAGKRSANTREPNTPGVAGRDAGDDCFRDLTDGAAS